MEGNDVRNGMRVKTNAKLGKTTGFLIHQRHLNARRPSTEGTISSYVPGHGGDVWFVEHDDKSIGAYMTDEFEPIKA